MTTPDERQAQIDALRQQIRELEASLPAHSLPPSLLARLEDLEDELAALLGRDTPPND